MSVLEFIHHVYLLRNTIFRKLILFPSLNKKRLFNVKCLIGRVSITHSPGDDETCVGGGGSRVLCKVSNQLHNYRVS
jgi:hypothetical protein